VLGIAVGTGFTTASHFSRAYRRAFGLSPKAERARQTTPRHQSRH
jgi:transcriptional regulator GlxA family with amidase domain